MSRIEKDLAAGFQALVSKSFKAQACWFLNGFWSEVKDQAETVWNMVELCKSLDKEVKGNGAELDEFSAHRFLEKLGETLTVQEMRNKLREIDLDFNKKMAITEYLIFKYKKKVRDVVNAPQGGEEVQAEIRRAQAMVDEAQAALESLQTKLEQAKKAESEAKQAEAEAKSALDELHSQEQALATRKADLEKKSTEGSTVAKGKAISELEQLKSEDPLPLRRAKINQEATVRKVERARKAAEDAAAAVAAATRQAEGKFAEASDYLVEISKKGGDASGDIWWLEREMTEKKKYMPKSKQ